MAKINADMIPLIDGSTCQVNRHGPRVSYFTLSDRYKGRSKSKSTC